MSSSASDSNETVFQSLVAWIVNAGGAVHPFLELKGESTARGVFAKHAILKGDLLIQLPAQLALSGEFMPPHCSEKAASPWLRCLAALYQAKCSVKRDTIDFTPYLESLPLQSESVLYWSDLDVSNFLAGTALGHTLSTDRREGTMKSRYESAVRPYLQQQSIESDFHVFLQACSCISTRGFHLQLSDKSHDMYNGPFLLPLIDLLNHDVQRKCTTLQRDTKNGSFCMVAERDIQANEEVFHSYGDDLTSTQLLQTFGFVSRSASQNIAAATNTKLDEKHVSPAVLNKSSVVTACHEVDSSGYAKELCQLMESNHMVDETWDVVSLEEMQKRADNAASLIPEHFVITCAAPLTDELVTLCSLLLLPTSVYNEFMQDDEPALLDKSVLQDYYLGKLVCKAHLIAITNKLKDYSQIQLDSNEEIDDDRDLLSKNLQKASLNQTEQRAVYGLTIRLEEKACLNALRTEVLEIMDLSNDTPQDLEENGIETSVQRQNVYANGSEPKKRRTS